MDSNLVNQHIGKAEEMTQHINRTLSSSSLVSFRNITIEARDNIGILVADLEAAMAEIAERDEIHEQDVLDNHAYQELIDELRTELAERDPSEAMVAEMMHRGCMLQFVHLGAGCSPFPRDPNKGKSRVLCHVYVLQTAPDFYGYGESRDLAINEAYAKFIEAHGVKDAYDKVIGGNDV